VEPRAAAREADLLDLHAEDVLGGDERAADLGQEQPDRGVERVARLRRQLRPRLGGGLHPRALAGPLAVLQQLGVVPGDLQGLHDRPGHVAPADVHGAAVVHHAVADDAHRRVGVPHVDEGADAVARGPGADDVAFDEHVARVGALRRHRADQRLERLLADERHERLRLLAREAAGGEPRGEHHLVEVERHLGLDGERERLLDLGTVGERQRDRVERGELPGPRDRDRGGAAGPLGVGREQRLERGDAGGDGRRGAALLLHARRVAAFELRPAGGSLPHGGLHRVAPEVDGDQMWHQRTRQ
jgi:hypothetical protein